MDLYFFVLFWRGKHILTTEYIKQPHSFSTHSKYLRLDCGAGVGWGAGVATPGCGVRVDPVGGDNVDTPGCGDGVISGLGAAVGEHSSFLQQESAGSATIWQFVGILGYTAHLKLDKKGTVNTLNLSCFKNYIQLLLI